MPMNEFIHAVAEFAGRRGINSLDELQYFSWLGYVIVGVGYTALVFRGELSKQEGPLIFSRRNARALPVILVCHAAFLAILFVLLRTAAFALSFLPDLMTDTFVVRGARVSIADLVFILMVVLLHLIERRWLYEDADAGSKDSGSEFERRSGQGKQ